MKFKDMLRKCDSVFNPCFSGYHGVSGPLDAKVNLGPIQPPQRKGRVPQYSKDQLVTLQEKFDELESIGVFARPEQIGVTVEYVNLSFLVKKPTGGFRLVTAFADVGRYSKPQPSLMPNVVSTPRQIAQLEYIVISDLTKSFYQIPLSRDSMKYCGVATPFRGVRVYVRSAMGMPGSETALKLTCRVLGHFVQEGVVAKIADDLYGGGHTQQELLNNWERVLDALQRCNLNLSASQTSIAPKQATTLGQLWQLGTIQTTSHQISTLSSCQLPKTVTALRSFIGAYKVLSRVIKNTLTDFLSKLENVTAGRDSKDSIVQTDELQSTFARVQEALLTYKAITLPRPSDQLWIVTDGVLRK